MKYSLACDTWDNKELEAIQSVIKSGRYTMGPRVKQFEKEIVFFRVYQSITKTSKPLLDGGYARLNQTNRSRLVKYPIFNNDFTAKND